MPEMMGMGHSTVERACELAAKANAKQLILFHHAPGRTDEMLDANKALADSHLAGLGSNVRCTVASEGLSLDV
jgi:ribonuclease BN (tRNA processing enzyme)